MVTRAYSVAFQGVEARMVEVQCAVTPGLPAFSIVGLPDKAVSEARDRVRTALTSMAIALPSKRITVNLSPADLPKEGSHFDLPNAAYYALPDQGPRPRGSMPAKLSPRALWAMLCVTTQDRCPCPPPSRARLHPLSEQATCAM